LPLARLNQAPSVEELIAKVRSGSENGLGAIVLDALLPKETHFFRDNHPFELLRNQIFRALEASRYRECRLTIWCAGCASGQEVYSVAMVLARYFSQLLNWEIQLFGTDISSEALDKAATGQFDEIEVHRGVQPLIIREYFRKDGPRYAIKEDISKLVQFSHMNLIEEWPALPQADIVFMRNVLRYLNSEARRKILTNLKSVLKPDGYLFLGAQESLVGIDETYNMVPSEKTVYYQLTRTSRGI
jgi:chemotaxis protein methyltransferase CheR